MKERVFRFKQFSVRHQKSAMKVGVDAVLLAAWADVRDRLSILDVGTGCGVIALAMAQRAETARIDAIEIDPPSFEEALENFSISPWADRLRGYMVSFDDFVRSSTDKYDLIISNPPFFDSGITTPSEGRETARHIGSLSPFSLLCLGKKLITENGIIALISPAGMERRLMECAEDSGLSLIRMIRIKGTVNATTPKRIMMEFGRKAVPDARIPELLAIQLTPGIYTEEYIALTQDFYLKF